MIISGDVLLETSNSVIKKNKLLFFSKFSKINFTIPDSAEVIHIEFEYTNQIPLMKESSSIKESTFEMRQYAQTLYAMKNFDNHLPGTLESILMLILNEINLNFFLNTNERKLLKRSFEWIEANSKSNISASIVASAMNCSVAHLNRIMKQHTGKCLSELISQRRTFEIEQLYLNSNYTTKEIAEILDFESSELLRKYFKYHTGSSIKEYFKNRNH